MGGKCSGHCTIPAHGTARGKNNNNKFGGIFESPIFIVSWTSSCGPSSEQVASSSCRQLFYLLRVFAWNSFHCTSVHMYQFTVNENQYSSTNHIIHNKVYSHNTFYSQRGQLPVGFIAQLLEHYTGITEVMGSNPVQAWICSGLNFTVAKVMCITAMINHVFKNRMLFVV